MLRRQGFTLIELIVVLVIIGVCAAFFFPNFTGPTEQAKALTAQNNLLAIYSAEQNYNTNNGGNNYYCLSAASSSSAACTGDTTCADNLTQINCNLSLNIQDDGSYTYSCALAGGGYSCTALRSGTNTIVVTLNKPINLSAGTNPKCNLSPSSWCPG